MHLAVLKQSVKAVEILINGGADINSQDKVSVDGIIEYEIKRGGQAAQKCRQRMCMCMCV